MSEENVEVVRQIYEAMERDGRDGVTRFVSPDIELHGTKGGLSEGHVARGIQAVGETFDAWDVEAWEESRLTPKEFIDAGDQVVVLQHELRRGRGSGLEVESETAVLFELRDGRVIRMQGFMNPDEALAAVGLGK
jgi:ketosteroid isomerase-like protein